MGKAYGIVAYNESAIIYSTIKHIRNGIVDSTHSDSFAPITCLGVPTYLCTNTLCYSGFRVTALNSISVGGKAVVNNVPVAHTNQLGSPSDMPLTPTGFVSATQTRHRWRLLPALIKSGRRTIRLDPQIGLAYLLADLIDVLLDAITLLQLCSPLGFANMMISANFSPGNRGTHADNSGAGRGESKAAYSRGDSLQNTP